MVRDYEEVSGVSDLGANSLPVSDFNPTKRGLRWARGWVRRLEIGYGLLSLPPAVVPPLRDWTRTRPSVLEILQEISQPRLHFGVPCVPQSLSESGENGFAQPP